MILKNIKNSFEKQSFMVECVVDLAADAEINQWNSIYYRKPNNNHVLFGIWIDQESKIKYLDCSYKTIWSVFYFNFGMEYDDIQLFIQNMVLRHTNWGLVTPC